jgi:hypothetical protein
MHTKTFQVAPSNGQWKAGVVLSVVASLFLLMDSSMKILRLAPAVAGTTELGYPDSVVLGLGLLQIMCLFLYVLPQTSILGAVLLTGYLGGAIATHVRVGSPLLTHTLFPTYVAALVWGGVWLREPRLRLLLPFNR